MILDVTSVNDAVASFNATERGAKKKKAKQK